MGGHAMNLTEEAFIERQEVQGDYAGPVERLARKRWPLEKSIGGVPIAKKVSVACMHVFGKRAGQTAEQAATNLQYCIYDLEKQAELCKKDPANTMMFAGGV